MRPRLPHSPGHLVLAALIALAGCPTASVEPDPPTPPSPVDTDGDGVVDGEDCAPEDATTYPGATELCDGLDNDCDGSVPTDEADGDGDGASTCAGDCDDLDAALNGEDTDEDGVSSCDGDCDDGDPQRSPLLPEADVCDGIDSDCVPDPDEADEDGDGHLACDDDCRDDLPTVFTGAEEICDGLDNDCDGQRDEVPFTGTFPTGSIPLEDAAWTVLREEEPYDSTGTWFAPAGDVDADGYDDILIATWPNSLSENWRPPRAYLVYGPVCGEAILELEPAGVAGAIIMGLGEVSYLGDVNDDGFDDVRFGDGIYFGPLSGMVDPADADVWFANTASWSGRRTVAFGTDLNGDGEPDLAVGDPNAPTQGSGPGVVSIFYGPLPTGPLDMLAPDAMLLGEAPGSYAGWGMATPGDLDGDGVDDIVVGSWNFPVTTSGAGGRRGLVHIVYGPIVGTIDLATEADARIQHSTPGAKLGYNIAGVGDTDGDGLPEFVAYARPEGSVPSGIYRLGIVLGAADESSALEAIGDAPSHTYGANIAALGDYDADGLPDWSYLSWFEEGGGLRSVLGSGQLVDIVSDGNLWTTASLGSGELDFNGDGADDLLIGAYRGIVVPGTP